MVGVEAMNIAKPEVVAHHKNNIGPPAWNWQRLQRCYSCQSICFGTAVGIDDWIGGGGVLAKQPITGIDDGPAAAHCGDGQGPPVCQFDDPLLHLAAG